MPEFKYNTKNTLLKKHQFLMTTQNITSSSSSADKIIVSPQIPIDICDNWQIQYSQRHFHSVQYLLLLSTA